MKRQRGRGRRPGGGGGGGHQHNNHQPNRTMESNGPDTKVRGPAAHIYERYLQLARDAASSGDRVLSENYMQHADHYFRLVRLMQPVTPPQQERFAPHADFERDEETSQDNSGVDEGMASAESGAESSDAEASDEGGQRGLDRDGDPRRRRARRNRFRPGGADGEPLQAEGEGRRERTEGDENSRRERAPRAREASDDASGPEGFSNGPKPAFLRD